MGMPPGYPVAGAPGGYPYYRPSPVPQTSSNAIIAFVLSLVGIVASCLFYGLGIIASIVALVFASKAKKEIDASGGWRTGSGYVTAARIISWVTIALGILIIIAVIIVIIIAALSPNNYGPNYRDFDTSPEVMFPLPR